MIDAVLELAFISSMVAWLHRTASGTFPIALGTSTFDFRGEPLNLMTDQGHTSNGAAGTAFVLVGCGGLLALFLRGRPGFHRSLFSKLVYYAWVAVQIPALLLTLGALVYVFVVTAAHAGQTINVRTASALGGAKYPVGVWTPQNWYSAVLGLNIASPSVRSDIQSRYRVMLGWQYNLIPLLLVQLVETLLAMLDFVRRRKEDRYREKEYPSQA